MAEDPLHDIIEAVRARLRTEVETQLQTLEARQQQELAEAERRSQLELQTLRAEIEESRTAAAAAERAREEAEQALATERHLAQARLEEERRTASDQLEKLQQALQLVEAERSSQGHETVAVTASAGRLRSKNLLDGLREIDAAASVSDALSTRARAAAATASRSTLFLANGSQLDPWSGDPAAAPVSGSDPDERTARIAADASRTRTAVRQNGSCAVPVLLDGATVAVLCAEIDPGAEPTAAWADEVEVLARHGAARLGYLTALRSAQARQPLAQPVVAPSSTAPLEQEDTEAAARRYARLVVSEIKLYNGSAVEEGRSRRDLLKRLGPEIERARRLYEERVPSSVAARPDYFQQELVQTLAGGDPSRLG